MADAVVGEINLVSFKHEWIIRNFCINCKRVGESLSSPNFRITISEDIKYDWKLKLHPKGDKEENKDYLSLFLINVNKTDITVAATISILDIHNAAKYSATFNVKEVKQNSGYGFPKFLQRVSLKKEAKTLLDNDALTILCEITVNSADSKNHAVKAGLEFGQLQTLSVDFEQMMNQKDHSDVSINVGGKTLHAHKNILGKRSSVFAAMFQHNMKEKKLNKVEITDIKREVFEEMLRYMYCGKVNNIELIAVDLLAAADKYSLDGLVKMCEDSLTNTLSVAGIFQSLTLADRYRANSLRARAIEFIASHAEEIVNKVEFKKLPQDVLSDVCSALAKCKK